MITWLKAHKPLIALFSLLGSIAGVVFSASDLHDSVKEKRKKT